MQNHLEISSKTQFWNRLFLRNTFFSKIVVFDLQTMFFDEKQFSSDFWPKYAWERLWNHLKKQVIDPKCANSVLQSLDDINTKSFASPLTSIFAALAPLQCWRAFSSFILSAAPIALPINIGGEGRGFVGHGPVKNLVLILSRVVGQVRHKHLKWSFLLCSR